jgi:hypothetical protein
MMMQGRHFEDALAAAQLVAAYLENHRQSLDDEDSADADQQDLLLDQDCDHAHAAPERQRADVAHENLGGMRVVPEKTQRCAGHGAAEYRQLARARQAHQIQILGELGVAAGVGQHGHGRGGDDHQADRQAVEAVREVDRVRAADQNERDKEEEEDKREGIGERVADQGLNHQTGLEALEEGHVHRRRVHPVRAQ